jgi:hypothetical protein
VGLVVDGAEWNFNGWSEDDIVKSIERLISRVWTARDRNEFVWVGEDLQTRYVLGNHDLWSLRSPDAPIKLSAELWHGALKSEVQHLNTDKVLHDECVEL